MRSLWCQLITPGQEPGQSIPHRRQGLAAEHGYCVTADLQQLLGSTGL